jgi:hypothetical protein
MASILKTFPPSLLSMVLVVASASAQTSTYTTLMQDVLIEADLWSPRAEIMSANLGFEGIIGVPNGDQESPARAAGGTWETVTCSDPTTRALTTVQTPSATASTYGYPVFFADALPIVFSWPMLPSTVQPTDFMLTLNDGTTVFPEVASITPNFEYNERHIAVVFGQFANRELPTAPGAVFPRTITIVNDGTPLMLVGPNGPVSAVGLTYTMPDSAHPYVNGPYLLGAKLSTLRDIGESAPAFLTGTLPNDGIALYGDEGQYRLRIFYTGGFSPDGVRSIYPTDFATFFRIQATDSGGNTILITETNVEYPIDGGTVELLGLADLGPAQSSYDDCYIEDHDNYIDVILKGDEAAVRKLTAVELPSAGAYSPVYTPGGPGNNPTPGVTYTSPSQPGIIGITIALDDPMTVSYSPETGFGPQPAPTATPAPTPDPAPEITVKGRTSRKVHRARTIVRGTANIAIGTIEYRINNRRIQSTPIYDRRWSFQARNLKAGQNTLRTRTVDESDRSSAWTRTQITRR